MLGKELHELEVGHGVPRLVRVERAQRTFAAVAADRRVDASRSRLRPAADEREVAALDLPPSDRLLEAGVARPRCARRRAGRTCRGRDGGRSRDARGRRRPRRRASGAAAGASRSLTPGAGCTVSPAGLSSTSRCSSSYATATVTGPGATSAAGHRQDDLDDGAGLEPVALRALRAVHANRALAQQPLGERARADLGPCGERPVQARAGVVLSDREAESRHAGDHASGGACRQGRALRTGRRLRRR